MHCLPEEVAVSLSDLTGVDADTNLDSALRVSGVVLLQRPLDGCGGADCCHIGDEGNEKSIAQGFAYPTTECCDLVLHDRCL
jgi:hypothetical protein